MKQFLVDVAIENVAYHFDVLYTYSVPDNLLNKDLKGMRVMVPFGRGKNSKRQGVIFGVAEKEAESGVKPIISLLDENPVVSSEMLETALFLKDRTFCTYFEAIKVQMPTGFSFKTTENYFAIASESETKISDELKRVYNYMLGFDCTLTKKQIYTELDLPSDSKSLDKLIAKN